MYSMKHILTTALFGIGALTAFGQKVVVTPGASTEHYQMKTADDTQLTAGSTNYFFTTHFETGVHSHQMLSVTGGSIETAKLKIEGGVFNDSYDMNDIVSINNQAYVIVEHVDKPSGKMTYTARKLSADGSIEDEGIDLIEYAFEKTMNSGYFSISVSPDQQRVAVVANLPFDKKMPAKLKIAVYDGSLKSISESEYTIEGEDVKNKRIEVTTANDGTVYITKFTNTVARGYQLLVHQYNAKTSSVEQTYMVEVPEDLRIMDYTYGVNNANELVIAATYYEPKTVTVGDAKAEGILFFRNKGKKEGVMEMSTLDAPATNLKIRKILFSGETTFVVGEEFKEESSYPSGAMPTTSNTTYTFTHGNEYAFGFGADCKKSFELVLEQTFTARDFDQAYRSAYFVLGDQLTVVYNDLYSKYRETGDQSNNSIIPIAVQISPTGMMQPPVVMKNVSQLQYGYTLNPGRSVKTSENSILMIASDSKTDQLITFTFN